MKMIPQAMSPARKYLTQGIVAAFLVLAYAWLPAASAQTPTSEGAMVVVSSEEATSFERAFEAIARQRQVTFIVEGQPFRRQAETLGDLPSRASLDAMVKSLSLLYDYTAERRGNVFLLRKRYTDPNDVPCVTLEECRQALANMDRLLSKHSPNIPYRGLHEVLYRELVSSLTQEQIQRMSASQSPGALKSPIPLGQSLPLSDMQPRQRALLWQNAMHSYVQRTQEPILSTAEHLDDIEKYGLTFCYNKRHAERHGLDIFGYEMKNTEPNAPPGRDIFWPISHAQRFGSNLYVNGRRMPPGFATSRSRAYPPDPTEPTASTADTPPKAEERHATPAPLTLGRLVADLNAREADKQPPYRIEPGLSDKRITLIGPSHATPRNVLVGAVEIYGLRLVTETDGSRKVTYPAVPRRDSLTELSMAVRDCYPAPLYRALGLETPAELSLPSSVPLAEPGKSQAPFGLLPGWRFPRCPEIAMAMQRRLRAIVEPKVKNAKEKRVGLAEVDAEERSALAVLLMAATCKETSVWLGSQAPEWITRSNELHLVGSVHIEDGKKYISFRFALPNPDGQKMVLTGPSGTRLPLPMPPR